MDALLNDLRYGLRTLRRSPASGLVALLTLGLAIGLATSVFSLVNAIAIRPLPYSDPTALYELRSYHRGSDACCSVSGPDVADWRAGSRTLSDILLYDERTFAVRFAEAAEEVSGSRVSGNTFTMLGVNALVGRTLSPDDQSPTATPVVLLSHQLWRDRFSSDRAALGRLLRIDGIPHEIVGVMPEKFGFRDFARFWTPIPQAALNDRNQRVFYALGRIRAGVTDSAAAADLGRIAEQLQSEYPDTNAGWTTFVSSLESQRSEPVFFAMIAAGVFVLLIACANIGNLLLAHGAARRGELAIRFMMGASRARVLRQLITESTVIAAGGVGLGLLLSLWGVEILAGALPLEDLPLWLELGIDRNVLAFSCCVMVIAVATFGLAPALAVLRDDLTSHVKQSGRRAVGGRAMTRTRNVLVVGEVALSMVLLSSAGIMARGTMITSRVTPGYDPEPILSVSIPLDEHRYALQPARAQYIGEALRRVAGMQTAEQVAALTTLPVERVFSPTATAVGPVSGSAGARDSVTLAYNAVTPNWFATLGTPLVRGRTFNESDRAGASPVVILSQSAAERLWPGEDAIGKTVKLADRATPAEWLTVVGVVGDRYRIGFGEGVEPRRVMRELFTPIAQGAGRRLELAIRAQGDPRVLASGTRAAVQDIDPDQVISNVQPLADIVHDNVGILRWLGALAAIFATLALALAAIGLFGVIAFAVTQRTREIGVRLAVGASPDEVLRLMLGTGTRLAAIGIGCGILGALASGRVVSSVVFGVSPRDPLVLGLVALVLGGVTLLASWLPARRAARVDPLVALQAE